MGYHGTTTLKKIVFVFESVSRANTSRVRPDREASDMRQPGQTGKLQYSCEQLCCCSCARVEPVPRPRVERHRSENRTGFTAKRCRLRAQHHRSRARVSMATYLTKHMFYLFFVVRSLASQSGRTLNSGSGENVGT
jgi:hypothetical protein